MVDFLICEKIHGLVKCLSDFLNFSLYVNTLYTFSGSLSGLGILGQEYNKRYQKHKDYCRVAEQDHT